jgi:hypothetical protein
MKNWLFARSRIIAGVSSIVVIGWLAWPYYALYDFATALQNADPVALESRVEWDRVRQGLRGDLNAILLHHIRSESENTTNTGGALGTGIAAVLGPSLVAQLVDAYVTPQAISDLIRTGRPATSTNEVADANAHVAEKGKERHRIKWDQVKLAFFSGGPATFRVEIIPEADPPIQQPVILLFKWSGDWKLIRIFLPVDAIVAQQEADRRAKELAAIRDRDEQEQAILRERNERERARQQLPPQRAAAAVAQKVVLYDEDPSDPKGKRYVGYVGSALWRTETVSPGPGLAPALAIRADVEIPERHMRMTWSLRRNTDKALPASHTIEFMFTVATDFAEGGIANVPGVLMKQDEQARGVPLAGLAVKVTNGYFLIGLSAVDVDVQRNIQLLKERDWFDIPVVYTSGKRAILAMEKGTPGVRAFEEAFRAWKQ